MTGGGVTDVEPLTPVDTADRAAEARYRAGYEHAAGHWD